MVVFVFDRTDSGRDSLAHRWMKLVKVVDRGPWTSLSCLPLPAQKLQKLTQQRGGALEQRF